MRAIYRCHAFIFCQFFFLKILEKDPEQPNGPSQMSLVEIGPRFVMTPIKIFEGAFNGATVYSNPGNGYIRIMTLALNWLLFFIRIHITSCCTFGYTQRTRTKIQNTKRRRK